MRINYTRAENKNIVVDSSPFAPKDVVKKSSKGKMKKNFFCINPEFMLDTPMCLLTSSHIFLVKIVFPFNTLVRMQKKILNTKNEFSTLPTKARTYSSR